MTFTFTAYADLPPHVTTRTQKEMNGPRELTAEELLAAYADGSYWKPPYRAQSQPEINREIPTDDVDRNIQEEKEIDDFTASHSAGIPCYRERVELLGAGMEFHLKETVPEILKRIRVEKPVISSQRRFVAAMLSSDPQDLIWNRLVSTISKSGLIVLIRQCQSRSLPGFAWNQAMREMEPRAIRNMRYVNNECWRDPNAPEWTIGSPGFLAKTPVFSREETDAWMSQAEAHELPDRITRCVLSGESLIERKGGRFRSWRIAPNWQGMGLQKAREAVVWAAIEAGIVAGTRVGIPPVPVVALAKDGAAWAGLAVATKHPKFKEIARFLLMLQDKLYFCLDEADLRANQKAWDRVAAKAEKEDDNV